MYLMTFCSYNVVSCCQFNHLTLIRSREKHCNKEKYQGTHYEWLIAILTIILVEIRESPKISVRLHLCDFFKLVDWHIFVLFIFENSLAGWSLLFISSSRLSNPYNKHNMLRTNKFGQCSSVWCCLSDTTDIGRFLRRSSEVMLPFLNKFQTKVQLFQIQECPMGINLRSTNINALSIRLAIP